MHTISLPFKITEGEDVIHHKRLGYSVMVRVAYSLLAKSKKEIDVKNTLKLYQLHYKMESLSMANAILEAKAIIAQDKEFKKAHDKKRETRHHENMNKQKMIKDIQKEIHNININQKLSEANKNKQISLLKNKLISIKPKDELKTYRLGHIVFGGKANLIAHQKRVNKYNQEIQFTLLDKQLTEQQITDKVKELTNKINESKQEWKQSRLRPLSICGETRKGGNRFFKLSNDLKNCNITFIRKESGTKAGSSVTETVTLSLSHLNGKWHTLLSELVKLANDNKITLFFRLNDDKLDITYDESVLTKHFQLNNTNKLQKSDSLKVKNIKTANPLLKPDTIRYAYQVSVMDSGQKVVQFTHPESSVMTKIDNSKAIGIDLNPEWIGVSVINFRNNKQMSIHDVGQVKIIDYKLFKINVPCNNKDNSYNKKLMAQTLSGIADKIFKLVHIHHIGKIYLEDGLGKLKGKTKSRNLNGLLNYWGRSIFTRILERKANLAQCDSITGHYHLCKNDGELSYRTVKVKIKDESGKYVNKLDEEGNEITEQKPIIRKVKEFKQGIKTISNTLYDNEGKVIGCLIDKDITRLDKCVEIDYVWAGYSSIIGNMIDWLRLDKQALVKESSEHDSLTNACATCYGLIPDACGAGVEIARRGIVKSMLCRASVELPLFDLNSMIVVKKNILERCAEQSCRSSEIEWNWGSLLSLLRKSLRGFWTDEALQPYSRKDFVGYRNAYSSYHDTQSVSGKGCGICSVKNGIGYL